jgi:hypothetical protein
VPAGTTRALAGSGFVFDIAVLDIVEPEPGAVEVLLLLLSSEVDESGGRIRICWSCRLIAAEQAER